MTDFIELTDTEIVGAELNAGLLRLASAKMAHHASPAGPWLASLSAVKSISLLSGTIIYEVHFGEQQSVKSISKLTWGPGHLT
jgi:hypothetical protein